MSWVGVEGRTQMNEKERKRRIMGPCRTFSSVPEEGRAVLSLFGIEEPRLGMNTRWADRGGKNNV